MKWPVWIPYPISILRALVINGLIYLSVSLIRNHFSWLSLYFVICVSVNLIAIIHHLIYGGNKRSIGLESWWEAAFGMMVAFSSIGIIFLAAIPITDINDLLWVEFNPDRLNLIGIFSWIISSCLYHAEFLIRHRPPLLLWGRSTISPPPQDPIQAEIERLRQK